VRIFWVSRIIKFALFLAVACAAVGFIVMHLWNWLVPGLFGGPMLSFTQALGLFLLGRLLFGRFGGGGGRRMGWRRRMRDWRRLSPEEREKLRERMSRRCGGA
jgi:hypothetical protein